MIDGRAEVPEHWSWSPASDGAWQELARFVASDELPLKARLLERDLSPAGPAGGGARYRALRDLWSLFVGLRIPYQAPPWVAENSQRLRDPELTLDEGGTCLDLVLTFSAMALSAGLRPYLVVDPAHTEEAGHALVAIDLERGPEEPSKLTLVEGATPGWGLARRGELRALVMSERLVLLDCTHGAADLLGQDAGAGGTSDPRGVEDLDAAARLVYAFLDRESTGGVTGWTTGAIALVDVSGALRATGLAPHKVDKSSRPAITSSLPEASPWVPYPSREQLINEVLHRLKVSATVDEEASNDGADSRERAPTARVGVVLFGNQGFGKSRLAHEVATRSGGGAAWWLTANDDRTLRRSLASASALESGRVLQDTDLGRDEEADAGLARLSSNRMPWLVVLDNANCHPRDLKSLPRPRAHLGQRMIVTTLPEYAAAWTTALGGSSDEVDVTRVHFEVKPLNDDDLAAAGSTLPPVAREAAQGSALLVRAFEALARKHPGRFEGALAAAPGAGAVRLWNVFQELEATQVAAATRVAWLPPDGIPASIIGEQSTALAGAGLLTRSLARPSHEPLYDLHRTIGAAARATDAYRVQNALAIVDDDASRGHIDRFGDSETLDYLATELVGAHRQQLTAEGLGPALVRLSALLEVYGRVVQRAQRLAPDIGWSAEELLHEAQDRADLTPLERADCLHGQARAVNQDTTRNSPKAKKPGHQENDDERTAREEETRRRLDWVGSALSMIEEARELREDDRLLVARSEALRGLLMQKRARFLPSDQRLALLLEAYDLLTWSQHERADIIHEQRRAAGVPEDELDHDSELARSIFNLAGAANSLAAALPATDQEARAKYLGEAAATYERVRTLRSEIYGTSRPHPHILSCVRGLGLIGYQRAWLLNSSMEEKLAQLRTATEHLVRALGDDEKLDYEDGTDAAKTLNLLVKVTEMRLHLSPKGDLGQTQSQAANERGKIRTNEGSGDDSIDLQMHEKIRTRLSS
jgi:hypothetical protein